MAINRGLLASRRFVSLRVCARFREPGEKLIGSLIFCERLVKEPFRIAHPKLLCPRAQRAVARHLVMLDRLSGGDETGVEGVALLEIFHDLLAFLDDALDRLAGFARGLLAKDVEHLFQTFDMTCGLVTVG